MLVRKKGQDPEVLTWVLEKFWDAGSGGTGLSVKSDQEETRVAFRRVMSIRRQARMVPMDSTVGVPSSNPVIESSVRKWRGPFRKVELGMSAARGRTCM